MFGYLNLLRAKFWPAARPFAVALESHSPPLDGVRGLAVLLVLMYDCLKIPNDGSLLSLVTRKIASCGWIGVDLFFVLSGFLITGILLDTKGQTGYWKSFLVRRAVRIFPLYYATLLGVFVAAPLTVAAIGQWDSASALAAVQRDWFWHCCYLQNWLFAYRQSWPADHVLNHFWSLAIEEQFYLVWPLIVAYWAPKNLARLCLGLCATALALRFMFLMTGFDGITTYVMTITRMDSLCLGALVATAIRNPVSYAWVQRLSCGTLVSLFILTLGIDCVWPVLTSQAFGSYSLGHTLVGLLFAALIGTVAIVPRQHLLYRAFEILPLRTLGKYSYAIYVFHRFIYELVLTFNWEQVPVSNHGWLIFATTLILSLGAALLSWFVIERHFLELKRYAPRPGALPQRPDSDVSNPAGRITQASLRSLDFVACSSKLSP